MKMVKGNPISVVPPELIIATDASKTAWEAELLRSTTIGDQWSPMERLHHFNVLKMLAVELALKTFLKRKNLDYPSK